MNSNYEIKSPLNNYHNIILKISNQINEIFDPKFINLSYKSDIEKAKRNKLLIGNHLIFTNDSISLFSIIEIKNFDKDIILYIKDGIINDDNTRIIKLAIDNFNKLKMLFTEYYYVIQVIMNTYDTSISYDIVNTIYNTLVTTKSLKEINFLLPYKEKISNLDKTLVNLYSKFEYIISFIYKTNNYFNYAIKRVLSSELSVINNLDNLNYLEKETIKEGNININELEEFLKNIYFYGRF
jgi:hypothetical protein